MKIEKISYIFSYYRELVEISKKLHCQNENACYYGLTPRQEARVKNLETRASVIAEKLGLRAYHQQDPRGCSLYLIDESMNDSDYINGIAIC